jgi:hypothetical protein
MQKITRAEIKSLPKTRLHLGQFWQITRLFKDTCESVEVTLGDFRLEDCSDAEVQEIVERLGTTKVYSISVYGSKPTVHLDLNNKWRQSVYLADADDPTSLGLAGQVRKLLPHHLISPVSLKGLILGNAIAFLLNFLTSNVAWAKQGMVHTALELLDSTIVIAVAVGLVAYFLPGPVLYLEKRAERKTFLSVHGYDLLKGALLLILGSALTLIVQLVLKSMK